MKHIIAAVRKDEEFKNALSTSVDLIFDLNPDLITVKQKIDEAHSNGKKLYIHLDLANGIGKDKSGILYAKNSGVDGIISTRVNIIKTARELGLFTVQRFFIVDPLSVDTTIEAAKASKTDMIEVMPGIATKSIQKLSGVLSVPIIAGGLIENETEVVSAIKSGAAAVSTGNELLWNSGV